jgi:hypothetical protein
VYERLIAFTQDQGTKEALQFLMTREVTHMRAFTAALDSHGKPQFAVGIIEPTPGLVNQFLNGSTGESQYGETDFKGHCCINCLGRSSIRCFVFRQAATAKILNSLLDEADLFFDARLTCEAMASTDHTHHFKGLDRSGRCPHRLKASCGANDSLERAVFCFNDVVQVLAGPMFYFRRQLAFPLQPADRFGIGAELVRGNRGRWPVAHGVSTLRRKR